LSIYRIERNVDHCSRSLMDKPVQGPTAAAEDYLQVALDNMPGALVHTDEDLNIVFCNDRFQGDVSGPGRTAGGRDGLTRTSCITSQRTAITARAIRTRSLPAASTACAILPT
jgi:hypothetical protein